MSDTRWQEPEERPACLCSRCRQEVWPGELTYEQGGGVRLCPDCFEQEIFDRLARSPHLLGMELGYMVFEQH